MGPEIPDSNNIARYCSPRTVPDGNLQATAFLLRADESELSVNWLEYLGRANREGEIDALKEVFARKLTRVGASAKFAVLNVGKLCGTVKRESPDGRKLTVAHEREDDDPSHSCIYGLRHDDEAIAEMMVALVENVYLAK